MAKFLTVCLLATALVAVGRASAIDNEVDEEVPDDLEVGSVPSLLGMLGSKVSAGENIYDEYSDEEDGSDDDDVAADTDEVGEVSEEAPTAPCCFPKVWQGRLKSDFGFVPVGGGRRGGKRDGSEDDEPDKKGKKHKGGKKKGGDKRRGRPMSARAVDQVYVDGTNRRIAGDKTVFIGGQGKPLNFSYIVLLGANRTADLYLFNRSAQKCRHRQLANIDWHQQCLPKNATLRGQFSLGPAAGGLNVQSWAIEAGRKRVGASIVSGETSDEGNADDDSTDEDDQDLVELFGAAPTTRRPPRPHPKPRPRVIVGANVLVVPGSCTPVVIQEQGLVIVGGGRGDEADYMEYFNGEVNKDGKKPKPKPSPSKARGEAFIGSVYFSNVQTSIRDPSVFTPPSYCNATRNRLYFDNMEDELPTLLERFLVL